jgi:hypothetical protein
MFKKKLPHAVIVKAIVYFSKRWMEDWQSDLGLNKERQYSINCFHFKRSVRTGRDWTRNNQKAIQNRIFSLIKI